MHYIKVIWSVLKISKCSVRLQWVQQKYWKKRGTFHSAGCLYLLLGILRTIKSPLPTFQNQVHPCPSMTQCQYPVITNCQCDILPPSPPLYIFPILMSHTPYKASHHDLVCSCFYPCLEAAILCYLFPNKSHARGLLHGVIFSGIPWTLITKILFHCKILSPAVCQRVAFHSAGCLCLHSPSAYMLLAHAILSFLPWVDSITTSILLRRQINTLPHFT